MLLVSLSDFNWTHFFQLQTMNESHRLIPLVPGLMQMMESEDDRVETMGNQQMAMMSRTSGALFARYLDKLIEKFLDNEDSEVLSEFEFTVTLTSFY